MSVGGFDDENIRLNRRSKDRYTVETSVQYFIKNKSQQFREGTIVNISRSGAAIKITEPVEVGQILFLEMLATDLRQINLRGQVKWYDYEKKLCGLAFSELINTMELDSMVIQIEQRREKRTASETEDPPVADQEKFKLI